MKTYTVYKHTLPDGKVYIGCTSRAVEERWGEGYNYCKNKRFYEAIKRFGWSNINHEIIESGLNEEEAFRIEHELIIRLNSANNEFGYNISTGRSSKGCKVHHSKETLEKISLNRKGKTAKENHPLARPVYCVELEKTFKCLKQAEEETGIGSSHICQACRGQRKSAGKLHWKYI